jgi:hypothetical protein
MVVASIGMASPRPVKAWRIVLRELRTSSCEPVEGYGSSKSRRVDMVVLVVQSCTSPCIFPTTERSYLALPSHPTGSYTMPASSPTSSETKELRSDLLLHNRIFQPPGSAHSIPCTVSPLVHRLSPGSSPVDEHTPSTNRYRVRRNGAASSYQDLGRARVVGPRSSAVVRRRWWSQAVVLLPLEGRRANTLF